MIFRSERHEHERALAVQGLRELEFDREMGKLSDADYDSMHKALEDRALTAMAAIENIRHPEEPESAKKPSVTPIRRPAPLLRRDAVPTLILHTEPVRPPKPPPPQQQAQAPLSSRKISFCPECGMRAAPDSKFCAQCGIAIRPLPGAIARNE